MPVTTATDIKGLMGIAAVIENTAHEVGIAVLTLDLNRVTLTQIVDNSLYTQTLTFLKMFEVKTVIFSQSLVGTTLYQVLMQQQVKFQPNASAN